jgi:hypothetical protein
MLIMGVSEPVGVRMRVIVRVIGSVVVIVTVVMVAIVVVMMVAEDGQSEKSLPQDGQTQHGDEEP